VLASPSQKGALSRAWGSFVGAFGGGGASKASKAAAGRAKKAKTPPRGKTS
jgi:hypothetical protein